MSRNFQNLPEGLKRILTDPDFNPDNLVFVFDHDENELSSNSFIIPEEYCPCCKKEKKDAENKNQENAR
jgi:hypothetical protein